ncbi:BsuBI/PstI family type II restriction endonuclease [Clostridium sp. UBA7503]|uniref:BsuBI/PstI family type II restriction endonuclease n=1 Tax=Clostridium sp. UBA7503 TaxID=1946377 RepID=UPI003217D59F
MNSEVIKKILEEIGFPNYANTDITHTSLLALLSKDTSVPSLMKGKSCLYDGARITDIISFANAKLGKNYAENTRESIRKTALKNLLDFGLIEKNKDLPERPINSGNTNYTINPNFETLIYSFGSDIFNTLKSSFINQTVIDRQKQIERLSLISIKIIPPFNDETFTKKDLEYSPGEHNIISKFIVEDIILTKTANPTIVHIGDTEQKDKYFNEQLVKQLNIPFSKDSKYPDLIFFDNDKKRIIIFEAVASSGPVDTLRYKELQELFMYCPYELDMNTVFLTDKKFKEFSNRIAPETTVYIIETLTKIEYSPYK